MPVARRRAHRIRPARHYQRRDDPVRAIAERAIPGVARDLRSVLDRLGDMVPRAQVAHHIKHADRAGVKRAIQWGHFREVLKGTFQRLWQARRLGAELGVRKINGLFAQARRPVRFRKTAADRFNFDSLDPSTQADVSAAQDALISDLEDTARDVIDTIIANGVRDGLGPEDIADNIRDWIGLTSQQAQAVANYQRMLYDLDPDALVRQLRNVEYDAALQDAIDSGQDLSDTAIERMTQDYADNYLDYRASMIAQTEANSAANDGLVDAYNQAVDRGAIPEEAITRVWQLADHPCPICESIPDSNPDGVGLNESFDSIDGPIDNPTVHPGCMCSVDIITDLSMVPEEGEA
jgi:hypothetical protein